MPSSHPDQPAAAITLWQQLGQTYCISLVGRDDRKTRALAEFEHVGLGAQVHFHLASPHPSNSEEGIYESHLACLRNGIEAIATADVTPAGVIVFEDDIFFARFSDAHLANVVHFTKDNHDWDIIFLGGFVKSSHATRWRGIRRIRYQCTAHAYLISPAFAQRLAHLPWAGKAYDDVLRDLPDTRYFALYPAIGFQSDSPSDNCKTPVIDRVRRMLGGMARLQRFNEFIHRHMTLLVVGHVVVLGALMVLAIMLRG